MHSHARVRAHEFEQQITFTFEFNGKNLPNNNAYTCIRIQVPSHAQLPAHPNTLLGKRTHTLLSARCRYVYRRDDIT